MNQKGWPLSPENAEVDGRPLLHVAAIAPELSSSSIILRSQQGDVPRHHHHKVHDVPNIPDQRSCQCFDVT